MAATLTGPEIARKKTAFLHYLQGGYTLKNALKSCELTEKTIGQWCRTDQTFSNRLRDAVGLAKPPIHS